MTNVYDTLLERGYLKQLTHEEEIKKILAEEKVTFYIGFDPTADSLHVGHFIAMMFMAHMQRAGHRPIALVGGGTAMIGDPSGKTDMRKMLSKEEIENNIACIKSQLSRLIDFSDDKAILENNADWLLNLNYVDFIRDIGVHFSVNRMLSAECFKQRLEKGLSFLEFNYMLMQGYDFRAACCELAPVRCCEMRAPSAMVSCADRAAWAMAEALNVKGSGSATASSAFRPTAPVPTRASASVAVTAGRRATPRARVRAPPDVRAWRPRC